jgi:ribonuclease-3
MADRDSLGPPVLLDRLSPDVAALANLEASHALQARLGHQFADPALLQEALTHGSAVGRAQRGVRTNERLEFLGDRVLGLVVAELLVRRFPDEPEGGLTPRFHALVTGPALAEMADEIGLGEALILSASEAGSGRRRPAILADAFEALLGALYLEGGLELAGGLVRRLVGPRLDGLRQVPREPKSTLQEWAQARALPLPVYTVVSREGPAHAPAFEIEVALEGCPPARASGPSKRQAEQAAAEAMLRAIDADAG